MATRRRNRGCFARVAGAVACAGAPASRLRGVLRTGRALRLLHSCGRALRAGQPDGPDAHGDPGGEEPPLRPGGPHYLRRGHPDDCQPGGGIPRICPHSRPGTTQGRGIPPAPHNPGGTRSSRRRRCSRWRARANGREQARLRDRARARPEPRSSLRPSSCSGREATPSPGCSAGGRPRGGRGDPRPGG